MRGLSNVGIWAVLLHGSFTAGLDANVSRHIHHRRSLLAESVANILAQAMLVSPTQNPETKKTYHRGEETKLLRGGLAAMASKPALRSKESIRRKKLIHAPLPGSKKDSVVTGESKEAVRLRKSTIKRMRNLMIWDLGEKLVSALETVGKRKRILSYGLASDDLEVSSRIFAQSVGWQSFAGRRRLRDKIALKILDGASRSDGSQGAKDERQKFVIGVMGTSVTAGHDNFFNESWSMMLGNLLRSPFGAAGMDVEVRNHAIGGNRYETSSYCIEATVGNDVDVIGFEFNMIFHGPADAFEHFLRNALSLSASPPVFLQHLGFDADNPEVPERADVSKRVTLG